MTPIRLYHSFRSPYSRLGLHIVERAGLAADVIPFTGPPEGVPFFDPVENKAKRDYYRLDAPRMTMRLGLTIMPPDPFEVELTAANKALAAAGRDERGLAFAIAVSDARWGRGQNISDINVLKTCAEECDWRADAIEAAQSDSDVSQLLKRHREWIEEDGVFGVPFAVMGDAKYWGHDRFELLVEDATG